MKVKDALAAGFTGVLTHGEAVGLQPRFDPAGDFSAGTTDRRGRIGVGRPQIRYVSPRNHERVAACGGTQVKDGKTEVVLGDDMRLSDACRDLAERTRFVVRLGWL